MAVCPIVNKGQVTGPKLFRLTPEKLGTNPTVTAASDSSKTFIKAATLTAVMEMLWKGEEKWLIRSVFAGRDEKKCY